MNVLSDNQLQATEKGLDLFIRLPWYRALPLSVVEIKDVRIDGQAVAPEKITLGVNGKDFPLGQLGDKTGDYWFVLDSAVLHVDFPGAKQGAEYDVEATLVLYPPYISGIAFPNQAKSRMRAS